MAKVNRHGYCTMNGKLAVAFQGFKYYFEIRKALL